MQVGSAISSPITPASLIRSRDAVPTPQKQQQSPFQQNTTGQATDSEETNAQGLTQEEQAQVAELKKRDREVRAHEQAHKAAGGSLTGPISYTYQTGPDNKRYAVGGEVPIDTSPVPNDPEATVRKMQKVVKAALAPADPSPQDRQVAAQAQQQILQAQAEAAQQRQQERSEELGLTDSVDENSNSQTQQESIGSSENPNIQTYQQNQANFGDTGQEEPALSLFA